MKNLFALGFVLLTLYSNAQCPICICHEDSTLLITQLTVKKNLNIERLESFFRSQEKLIKGINKKDLINLEKLKTPSKSKIKKTINNSFNIAETNRLTTNKKKNNLLLHSNNDLCPNCQKFIPTFKKPTKILKQKPKINSYAEKEALKLKKYLPEDIRSLSQGEIEKLKSNIPGINNNLLNPQLPLQNLNSLRKQNLPVQSIKALQKKMPLLPKINNAPNILTQQQERYKTFLTETQKQAFKMFENKTDVIEQEVNKLKSLKEKYNKLSSLKNQKKEDNQNSLKGTPFKKRWVWGLNFQWFQKPFSIELNPQLAYRLNKKNLIGVGANYRTEINYKRQHIKASNKPNYGFNLFAERSHNNWFFQAIYENKKNYNQVTLPSDPPSSDWVRAGLIGLGKRYNLSGSVKGKIAIQYDFFHEVGKSANHKPIRLTIGVSGF